MNNGGDFDRIPIIDLGPLADGGATGLAHVAREFDRAYSQVGFAYVSNHGVQQTLVDAAFDASHRFHAQPLEAKQRLAINRWHRGYMGLASSLIVTSSVEKASRPNQSESLMFMHERPPDDPEVLAGKPLAGPNQWPDDVPGFRDAIGAYERSLEALARRLTRVVAMALGLPPDGLDQHFERPTTFLRLLHYPPQPVDIPQRQYGSAPHTDYGFITLLAQDASGGLQVQNDAGAWIDATPIPGTFVLNVGDMTARWSNDRWRSTRHRVINRSGGDRYSLPYFFDPHMDVVVTPLASCVADGAPRHEPVCYGEYLMYRLDANYDYRSGRAEAS